MPFEDGKPYRPINGTEGMGFVETYCMNCIHEKFSHTQCHDTDIITYEAMRKSKWEELNIDNSTECV